MKAQLVNFQLNKYIFFHFIPLSGFNASSAERELGGRNDSHNYFRIKEFPKGKAFERQIDWFGADYGIFARGTLVVD